MNLKNKPPVFVPAEYRMEVEQLSKAALMDMVWDYASRCADAACDPAKIMGELRATREIVLHHRRQA